MTAAKALAQAAAAGIQITVAGSNLRLLAAVPPPDELLADLRAHKADLLRLLAQQLPEPTPDWTDDPEWIRRWRYAGPSLADREPVLRAWIAAAPPEPLPYRLAALELRRIAREHAIEVEVAPAVRKPDRHIARLLAAADRALHSPDAIADEAEVMIRGEIE